jgi:glycine betaine transporter
MHDILSVNLKIACGLLVIFCFYILCFKSSVKHRILDQSKPTSSAVFVCLLFTSGLDTGLILLPLIEFEQYTSPEYLRINPLSIEVGYWGGLVWIFYFITTFYFAYLEPVVKILEHRLVRVLVLFMMFLTPAFTAKIFADFFIYYVPSFYLEHYPELFTHNKIILYSIFLIIIAAISAMSFRFIKFLSLTSIILFCFLILGGLAIVVNHLSPQDYLITTYAGLAGYLLDLDKFIYPMNEHHEFYMYWWFSWSIIVGKFLAKYVPEGMKPMKLFILMTIVPTIPIFLWFSVVYHFFVAHYQIPLFYSVMMFFVGVLFMINSMDSIFRESSALISLDFKKMKSKTSLFVSFLIVVISFVGYTGLYEGEDGFMKIDYTGTLAILLIYYIFSSYLIKSYRLRKETKELASQQNQPTLTG